MKSKREGKERPPIAIIQSKKESKKDRFNFQLKGGMFLPSKSLMIPCKDVDFPFLEYYGIRVLQL